MKDGAARNRQGQQERGFAIAKKIGVADDEVAQQQEDKQECEQEKQEALGENCAEAGKAGDELKAEMEQGIGEHKIARDEKHDDAGKQPRLLAHGLKPAQSGLPMNAHEQPKGSGSRVEVGGGGGHFNFDLDF